ncbi:DUF2800 domain-containing protein [Sporosarcina newyorkensis]|nr:DUF2800 domain-containing protein [Sporosarcina newyorkensis]
MAKHAFLSPSSSHRWLNCPPSLMLGQQYKDTTSSYAAEGTDAHTLCEYKLQTLLGIKAKDPRADLTYYDQEMETCAEGYASFVLELLEDAKKTCSDPLILIEQRLDYSKYAEGGFGTGDCVLVSDDTLHVIDFKYGSVLVESKNNSQMMLYALGALELFDGIYDIETISMTIYQPRRENISTFTLPKEELLDWAITILQPKAALALQGEGEFNSGEWCRFCKVAPTCRARAEANLKIAQYEFKKPPLLTDEEIADILKNIAELTKWANEITSYATSAAINQGKVWPGFKVVEGRSIRKYTNEDDVEKAAMDAGFKDIYKKSLLTITNMEKLMGKAKFNEILGAFVMKPKGKPTLVPSSDKRPELKSITVKNEFTEEK